MARDLCAIDHRTMRAPNNTALLLAMALAVGCKPKPEAIPQADTAANVQLVTRFINEVVNGGHIDAVDSIWSADMHWHSAGMGDVQGRDAYKTMLHASVGRAFTGMDLRIIDTIAAGDKVVLYFTNSGRNTGSFHGMPATDVQAEWEGIGIYRIDEGRIAEAWFVEDHFGLFTQLGLIQLPSEQ